MENLLERKKKLTNIGNDKPYEADSLIHNTTCRLYLIFVSNFKILGQKVPEKSLTKISIFISLV